MAFKLVVMITCSQYTSLLEQQLFSILSYKRTEYLLRIRPRNSANSISNDQLIAKASFVTWLVSCKGQPQGCFNTELWLSAS